ncbi:hypothetical protein D9756_009552 [Leucocoprinus leucothites]|uniref:Amine oxidase domain-containing protein n=1 Tax=Leucocoprinus leucothites TaxID=201217 RepID=A0A8H5CUT2_9AGAR|nr:hypothetical protein D9756_009552 [Leucoagaricus leucothites]
MIFAVIGSGVSGLAATWLLNEYSDHEVHLYEADDRPGGHANTVRFRPKDDPDSEGVDVDTRIIPCKTIVFNPPTYPNFLRFLQLHPPPKDELPKSPAWPFSMFSSSPPEPTKVPSKGIRILPTEMTFSVSRDGGDFEWAGKNPFTVFCQPRRLFDPAMWRMLYDVFRFNACALRYLRRPDERRISIGQYLKEEGYSDAFKDNYLIPMTAAVWSTPPDRCFDDFPAQTLITGKPKWLTICGGSRRYVDQILSRLPKAQLHLSSRINCVSSVLDESGGRRKLEVITNDDEKYVYDHVIFACHSDDALRILQSGGDLGGEEERILDSFEWNKNEVVLHNGMNDLQDIPEDIHGPVLATLNPPPEVQIDENKVQGRWRYEHPVLDDKAVSAQRTMHLIQNKRSISYAGAYLKYGFHEDGFTSGLLAACSVEDETLYERIHAQFSFSSETEKTSKTIKTKNVTVRPPFDIRHADHHLFFKQSVANRIVAGLFGVFEVSGMRSLIGTLGSIVFGLCELLIFCPFSVVASAFGQRQLLGKKKAL